MAVLTEVYADRKLYSSPDMFSPPAERVSHAIRFELTSGCPWGLCTYCSGYQGIPFQEKTLDQYKTHVNDILGKLDKPHSSRLTKVFIGGGDALAIDTAKLSEAISFTRAQFLKYTFAEKLMHYPSRISIYGSVRSLASKSNEEMRILFTNHLSLIYWGLESGSAELLDYVNKGCNPDQLQKAAIKAHQHRYVDFSVMIMPGLGGKRFEDLHTEKTAEILGQISPKYVTFMGVNPAPQSRYARRMTQEIAEGTNRPLTDEEMIEQMLEIIRLARFQRAIKIGCFSPDIDQVSHNPAVFGSVDILTEEDRIKFVDDYRKVRRYLAEFNAKVLGDRKNWLP